MDGILEKPAFAAGAEGARRTAPNLSGKRTEVQFLYGEILCFYWEMHRFGVSPFAFHWQQEKTKKKEVST